MNLRNSGSRFMETESILRLLLRFAGPAMVGMIASAVYNIVDRIFVGRIVGADAIAAIALGFPCMLFFFAFSILVGLGGASRIALQLGAKNNIGAKKTLGCVVFLCCVASLFAIASGLLFTDSILRMSGASDVLLPMAREYLSIILWGIFFFMCSFAGSCVIQACGSPNYAMGTQVIGAIINVALDAWFVIWLQMGVQGAAIATVISQFISMLWVALYFFTSYARIRLRLRYVIKPDREALARVLAIGIPPFLVHLTFVIIQGIINVSVAKYGGDIAVSATGILMSMDSLLFMPAVAIGEGAQPIIGYNYGAKRFDRVRQAIKLAVAATTVFYILSFLAIQFNTEFFIKMFNNKSDALIKLTADFMHIAYIAVPVMGIPVVTSATLQGLGRARDGFVLSFIRFGLLLLVPLAIVPHFFGLYGIWVCFPISDIIGSAISFFYLYRIMLGMKEEIKEKVN